MDWGFGVMVEGSGFGVMVQGSGFGVTVHGFPVGWQRALHLSYRGTSLIRNQTLLGPYSRPMPRALWWS
jgi:hypothetical protein